MVKPRDELKTMEKGFDYDQALTEAGRCLLCHEPPCSKGCPAKTDPGEFIKKFRLRNTTGAIRTIKENNILGGACGVLCPTSRLCEMECSACGIDRPIQIGKIQRFLVEHSWKIGFKTFDNPRYEKPKPQKAKVAVIGGGPSGLACAAELAKNGFPVTVFEERAEPGGVLRYGVPSYRFSSEFLDQDLNDLKSLGVKVKCSHGITGENASEKLLADGYKAVYVGIGLWAPMTLNVTKKEFTGWFSSIRYLEMFRQEKFRELEKAGRGKVVVVIGGGSVAIDCARTAMKLGASDVYLVYRRSYSQMPAEKEERVEALDEGIHFLLLNQPVGYSVDARGKLKGVRLVKTRLAKLDASGRRKPFDIPGSEWLLEADTVIEAIGNQAPKESPALYPAVKTNADRLIAADKKTGRTSKPGIFAGGDIVNGPGTVVQAIADGKAAAESIMKFLLPVRLYEQKN